MGKEVEGSEIVNLLPVPFVVFELEVRDTLEAL